VSRRAAVCQTGTSGGLGQPSIRKLSWRCAIIAALAALFAFSASPAEAKLMFGTKEYLKKIQDLTMTGPNGEALYLGHKFSQHAFFAPYRLTDDGYILGVKGQDRYLPLDKAKIETLQAARVLPSPLPKYKIAAIDRIFGHLLWIALLVLAPFIVFSVRKQRMQEATS
jgi:hypothetical protein